VSGARAPKGIATRATQAVVLVLVFGLLYGSTRLVPQLYGTVSTVAAVGFLLLAGTLLSELGEALGIPHLTGYLVAGILAGPHVFHLLDHETVESLSSLNALALSLIALAGGAELKLDIVTKGLRSLAWATLFQSLPIVAVMAITFILLRPFIPFAQSLSTSALAGAALMWGVLSTTRSPSATLGILSQTRAVGPIATSALTVVMTSDIVVVVLMATAVAVGHPLIEPGVTLSLHAFEALGHELIGSVSLGTTLGLVLVIYLRFVKGQLLAVLLALGFGFTEVINYLRLEPLLTFMVAGFLVRNLSKQGDALIHGVEAMGSVVFVVFFATAGADLDVPLLRVLWPVALVLCVTRAGVTVLAARIASRLAADPPSVRRWGWAGLISQAGLALGLSAVVERTFPLFGTPFRALAIATVAMNEMIGPILFKIALDRGGESSRMPDPQRPTGTPPPPGVVSS
jgi:Kef-type K+ transport system membrane component KefB